MEGGLRSLCVFPSATSEESASSGHTTAASSFSQSNHVRGSENVNPHLTGLFYFSYFSFILL